MDSEDIEVITKASEALDELLQKVGSIAYAQEEEAEAPEAAEEPTTETPETDEDVIDGEVKDA